MGRLIFLVLMLIVSGVIYLIKAGAGKITGNEVSFQDESKKVMEKTARGINWMNEQWENAKSGNSPTTLLNSNFSEMSAVELIALIKSNPSKYNKETSETLFIEQAVERMNRRHFDDAIKLIMQLDEGEGRKFMLTEVETKRNA